MMGDGLIKYRRFIFPSVFPQVRTGCGGAHLRPMGRTSFVEELQL